MKIYFKISRKNISTGINTFMEIKQHETKVFGQECKLELMYFNDQDGQEWKRVFDLWKKLKLGLRKYKAREPNFPEGLIWTRPMFGIPISGISSLKPA